MDLKKIVIAGAGTMGSSMAETFAKFGYDVIIYDIYPEALLKAQKLIAIHQGTEIDAGLVTAHESQSLISRISFSTNKSVFENTDFVIEAILENMETKQEFWSDISSIVAEDTILASNTSGLSISDIGKVVKNPSRFVGMHWVNPPHIIPLIEVIKGNETSQQTADFIKDLSITINKKPAIVNDALGFVLNRIQLAILRECLHILESNIADEEAIDDVMKYGLGPRYACLGPLEVCDHGGLDIFYNISTYLFNDLADNKAPFGKLKELVESGDYGVKSGKGFYDYTNGKSEEAIKYRDLMYTKVSKCLFGGDY